jgi:zinc protease
LAVVCCSIGHAALPLNGDYAVVVSTETYADADWKEVVEALVAKHRATVIQYKDSVTDSLPELTRQFPRYICFVARPAEAGTKFVADVNRLTRQLDDDPYTDAIWGILTGYDAKCALRIAALKEPLVIHRTASGTEIELSQCDEGIWFSELERGKMVRKTAGEKPADGEGPADSTKALVDVLNDYQAQLFVTSGHATERDWQIGYGYRNGQFRSHAGELFGVDTKGQRIPVASNNPKVYLPVGNCLMGHIDGPDAMALAFMNSAGVDQMIGYTVPSWYGYGGWGLLDYFVEQPGRYTLAEAFYVNQQALLNRLETYFPDAEKAASENNGAKLTLSDAAKKAHLTLNDARGLLYDRDTVAFYGDPAWSATMAPAPLAWDQALRENHGHYEFEIVPKRGEKTFDTINNNGSQRGGRPIVELLPHRIKATSVKITDGADLQPLVTSNFILVPRPEHCDPNRLYRVVFTAEGASASESR